MDSQYGKGLLVKLVNHSYILEPNRTLPTPLGFKEYVAHKDENILMVANRFYQETAMWYHIAKFSGIVDPTDIPEGTILLLPYYEDKDPKDIFI